MMHDYGSFVPVAMKASLDPSFSKLGRRVDYFKKYTSYATVGFPSVVADTHALMNTREYMTFLRDGVGFADETYIMKETVSLACY